MVMKIPKKIHFSGFDYSIQEVEKLDGGDNWGRTMMGDKKIFLNKNIDIQCKEETFIHELMHIALRHTMGWEQLETNQEEKLVKAWSMNIYGILKDNNLLK